MDIKFKQMDLVNKWVLLENFNDSIKQVISEFKGKNLFGYVYIDHEAGITLDVIKLFDFHENRLINRVSPSDKKIRAMVRFDVLVSSEIKILTDAQIVHYDLKVPDYLKAYECEQLLLFREDENLHEFRADGFPDDVEILLPPTNELNPELVWGRVEKYDKERNLLTCKLLNEPNQDFELCIYDTIQASKMIFDEKYYLVYRR